MHDVAVTAFADAKETAPMQSAAARLRLAALEKEDRIEQLLVELKTKRGA